MVRRGDFSELLVRQGVLKPEQVAEVVKAARAKQLRPWEAVVSMGLAPADVVTRALAQSMGLNYVDLDEVAIPPHVVQLVPEAVAREHAVLPLSLDDDELTVILSDPEDLDTLDKLRFILNRKVNIALAPRERIMQAVNKVYSQGDGGADMYKEFAEGQIDFTEAEGGGFGGENEVVDESSAPIIKLVQMVITEAVTSRASDIHIEPFEDRVRIRYRIDGVLVERDSTPRKLLGAILSRIKILAKIDIAERRRPQDGRIKVTMGDKELDLRVSVLPTNHGQSVVMRVLDKDNIKVGLRQLGLSEDDYRTFNQLIRRPNGIILVTGPTGSGKTTTLYAALNDLNRPDRKIITAEDPVEYYLQGINQVEVKHSIGLDFARIIRAMLRQAPNVILVGEMRDSETAEMGIQASLTGHLVFSTLHTNDAPSAITRMVDMGVPAYLVASSVIGILAQRLVRLNCKKCAQPYTPPEAVLQACGISEEQAIKANFMKGRGCGHCHKTGYRGRMGVYELMTMTSRVRELAFQGASTQTIRKAAMSQGMRTLFEDGVVKAMKGITTLDEVFRVAKQTEQD